MAGVKRWIPIGLVVVIAAVSFGVYLPFMSGRDPAPTSARVSADVWSCHALLIGKARETCTRDIQGPGRLTITFRPDPPQGGWEVGVSGLAALAEACEFHGSYDQTRLSALQGRGETSIVCPITPSIDQAFHEIAFTGELDAAGTSMAVRVIYER